MHTELGADLSLPSVENQSAATSFECIFEASTARERDCTPILTHNPVEYLYSDDAAAPDNGVDFGAPSASDQPLDRSLSDFFENCYPEHATPLWPALSAVSFLHSSSPHSNKQPETVAGARQRSNKPRVSVTSAQKIDQPRKTNGSQRPHYAVEKRYRSTLNEKYAALARALSSEAVQRICRTGSHDWVVQVDSTLAGLKDEQRPGSRQQKTATLSVTMERINILSRCCLREANELERLRCGVRETRKRIQHILEAKPMPSHEQHGTG